MKLINVAIATMLALLILSCQAPPETIAYNTLSSVWHTKDAAMKAYADYYWLVRAETGEDPEQHGAVMDAHEKFRLAFDQAVDAASQDWSKPAPESVSAIAANLIRLIERATQ